MIIFIPTCFTFQNYYLKGNERFYQQKREVLPCNNFLLSEFIITICLFIFPTYSYFFRLRKLKISLKNTIVSFLPWMKKHIIPFLILNLFSMIIDYQTIERRYQSVFDCVSNIKTWVYIFITGNLRHLTHNIRVR